MQIYFYLIIQFFFVWFWVKSKETLGMKTWKIRIVNEDGNKISYKQGVIRFNVAIISLLIFGLGFLIAIFGAIGFLITGSYLNTNIPLSIGFLNIPAFLIFIPITTFMARVGAKTVYKINKSKVQTLFGVFLYVVGTVFLYRYLNL